MKSGIKTTEFWITIGVNILAAAIGIFAIRGFVSAEEGQLYLALGTALVTGIAPLVMAYVTTRYIDSRTDLKFQYASPATGLDTLEPVIRYTSSSIISEVE